MALSRSRPKGACVPFGLAALVIVLTPSAIGYQDLTSAMARQQLATQRWRPPVLASSFGAIQPVGLHLPRPLGTDMFQPARLQLATLDIGGLDISEAFDDSARTRVLARAVPPAEAGIVARAVVFPTIDRTAKGDYLGNYAPTPDNSEAGGPAGGAAATTPPASSGDDEIDAAIRFEPFPEYDISLSLELHPQLPADEFESPNTGQPDLSLLEMANDPNPKERTTRLFFGGDLIGSSLAGIKPWAAGEEPILMLPRAPADPEMKSAALTPPTRITRDGEDGETIAGKGEVTSEGQRPMSPAERLGLSGKTRDKAEKCLANAVYFESRGEAVRGQIAVAQVVMNRVFSGYYPDDVCGVVYQNSYRHLACQFTFACDGIPDVVSDAESWERAKKVAKATLDGRVWLPEVGKATHYHASWVRPRWVREMRKLHKIGVHSFYRPRYWGDGANAPSWGSPTAAAEAAARM